MTGIVTSILDNVPSHPSENELNAVNEHFKVQFLPPNVTAIIQPLDQGLISLTKKHYKKNLLQRALFFSTGTEKYLKNLNLDDCFILLKKAWESLEKTTLHKVWRSILGDSLISDQNRPVDESSNFGNEISDPFVVCNNNTSKSPATRVEEESLDFLQQFSDRIVNVFPNSHFSVHETRYHLSQWLNEADNDDCR